MRGLPSSFVASAPTLAGGKFAHPRIGINPAAPREARKDELKRYRLVLLPPATLGPKLIDAKAFRSDCEARASAAISLTEY